MKELPVNMATHLAELATSLFGHLSDVPIDEQQQVRIASLCTCLLI